MTDPLRVVSALFMDRSEPVGNSTAADGRQALHVLVKNSTLTPIPVSVVTAAGISVFGEALAVVNSVETTVLTYTVPVGKILYLSGVELEGDNVGAFRLKENGTTIAKSRFGWTEFTKRIAFDALPSGAVPITAGTTLAVTVLQESRKTAGNYSARVIGVIVDE